MDKTPAWIQWTLLQAVKLDGDLFQKIGTVTNGLFSGRVPAVVEVKRGKNRAEDRSALEGMGFKVRRGK